MPPEFIGAEATANLKKEEWNALQDTYFNMKGDFRMVSELVSWESINLLMEKHEALAKRAGTEREGLRGALGMLLADLEAVEKTLSVHLGPRANTSRKHENFINNFLISYLEGDERDMRIAFLQAAKLRRCIG